MSNPFKQADAASKLSIAQLQQALQHGTVPPFIGIPLIQTKMKEAQAAKAAMAGQQKAPTIADQVMAQAQQEEMQNGLDALPSSLPTGYAAGGIIAFGAGGEAEDDDVPTFELASEEDEAAEDGEMDALYSGLGRLPKTAEAYAQKFEAGIGTLPAAEKAVVADKEGVSGFIDRILHKESRGQRYDKEGNLLTSPKGAKGEMQVMPNTSRDPGFGVRPARDDSPDELARVGRDYAQVMLDRYQDPKLAAIAYNMGPGATDKWLAAGADMSKLPRETQGYVKGFAQGGAIRFQNLGLVSDDYTNIPGLEPSNLYEESIKRAKAEREKKADVKEPLTENQKKYSGLWPYNAPQAGKFSYEDAAKFDASKTEPVKTGEMKPGITYAPNTGIGNIMPTRYVPKETNEPQSEYSKQMGNVAGFFGDIGKGALGGLETLGKHIVSAPGYGFSGVNRPEAAKTTAAATQKPVDFTQFEQATERYMNDRDQARLAAAKSNEDTLRAKVEGEKAKADVSKETTDAAKLAAPSRLDELLSKREANLEKQKSVDNYMALLSAGLGMMGGKSSNAFANIGAGAQQGINNLLQSNKLRAAEENAVMQGRLGQERYKSNEAYRNAMLDESKLRRDETIRQRLGQSILGFEKAAEDEAIKQIGQDKLGAMDPTAQAAAIRNKKSEILNSPTYREMLKRYHGENYIEPRAPVTGNNVRSWSSSFGK